MAAARSSGLGNFIGRENPRPTSPATARLDRAAASSKFKVDKCQYAASKAAGQSAKAPSIQPQTGYESNLDAARETFPNPQYPRQQTPPNHPREHRITDTSTVDDDFDKTASERHFAQRINNIEPVPIDNRGFTDQYGHYQEGQPFDGEESDDEPPQQQADYMEDLRYDLKQRHQFLPLHQLNHKQSNSPVMNQPSVHRQPNKASGITGRFDQATVQHPNLQTRPDQEDIYHNEPPQVSKKRTRSAAVIQEEPAYDNPIQHVEEGLEKEDEEEEPLPVEQDNEHFGQHERLDDGGRTPRAKERGGRLPGSSQPPIQLSQRQLQQQQKKLDIPDDKKLLGMTYSQVEKDSWELAEDNSEIVSEPAPSTLEGRLEAMVANVVIGDENPDALKFFIDMSSAEWEECGDMLVGKFSEVMKAMMENRKKRRAVTEEFEKEIAAREEIVRGKSAHLDKTFKAMKSTGEHVLRGKV